MISPNVRLFLVLLLIALLCKVRPQSAEPQQRHALDAYTGNYGGMGAGLELHSDQSFTLASIDPPFILHAAGTYHLDRNGLHFNIAKVQYKMWSAHPERDASGNHVLVQDAVPSPAEQKRQVQELLPTEYVRVTWDKSVLLIPPKRMLEFCNDVNNGFETPKERQPTFYYESKKEHTVSDDPLPVVPAAWTGCLLPHPIEGKIIAVEETGKRFRKKQETLVRIQCSIGKRQGLKVGMMLLIPIDPRLKSKFKFRIGSPRVVIRQVEESCCFAEYRRPTADQNFSVGAPVTTGLTQTQWAYYLTEQ